jgi:LacI family asc operon transcriptional repressor
LVSRRRFRKQANRPGDISLAGFDDSVIGKYFTPSLTTMHVPMDDMIRDAVEILLNPNEERIFSHLGTLVNRDSVARRVDGVNESTS